MLPQASMTLSLRIATVVVPVAVYFLVLGVLNSRRHPQLLSGRQDFSLLMIALSPLAAVPVLEYVGVSWWALVSVTAAVAGLVVVFAPRGHIWVIYNLSAEEARKGIGEALRGLGCSFREGRRGFDVPGRSAFLSVDGFPLLRNASIRLRGGDAEFARRFEAALVNRLGGIQAEANPAGVSLLLVATAMLVAPLALMAQDVPEIVRLLTDLF